MLDEQKISDEWNEALVRASEGVNRWPGMTYEQGVEAALGWVLGERDEAPITEQG